MFHQFKKKIHTVTVEGLKHILTSTSHGEKNWFYILHYIRKWHH